MKSKPRLAVDNTGASPTRRATRQARPSPAQLTWLRRGLEQPGGKLPLFDTDGQRVNERTVRACIDQGWAEPWFDNPMKPNWQVCKLTEVGRKIAGGVKI